MDESTKNHIENVELRLKSEMKELDDQMSDAMIEIKDLRKDFSNMSTRVSLNEQNIENITDILNEIKKNTTWLVRLIIGTIIIIILNYLANGGA